MLTHSAPVGVNRIGMVHGNPEILKLVPLLRGKRLGCVCKPLPCHGDVYLEILGE